jgi:hypothetical protein
MIMTEIRQLLENLEQINEDVSLELGDQFDIEINDDFVIESGIVGLTREGIILQGDDTMINLLQESGAVCTRVKLKEGKDHVQMRLGTSSDASAGGSYKLGENWDDEGTVPTEEMIDIIKRPFLTNNMMEKVGNVIGKYGPVRIMAAIEDYASGLYWPRGQGINSKDPWHWAYAVIKSLESGNYNDIDSVPVRKEVKITLPDWVRENSDENQDSVALEEEKEMDLEQLRAELRRDPTTRAAAQAIIKAITTDCEPSSYCIASLTMTYGPEAIIKSLYSTASASEPEDIASPEAIDKLVQKFERSLKYNAGELTEEQELDDKRIKEIKQKIEFYKLMGNEKAAAELEGMLRAGAISSATLKEESKDKSSVSMPARKLYTQTYAKHCKTAKDSKKAEQLAYDAVKEKFGPEVLALLKKHHTSNITENKGLVFKVGDKVTGKDRYGKPFVGIIEKIYTDPQGPQVELANIAILTGVSVSSPTSKLQKHYSKDITEDDAVPSETHVNEAKYRGRTVSLNKPTKGDVKKRKVYVRKPNGNVVKVEFGDPNMRIKKSNPARRKSFRARHRCDNPGPKWKARYWSCRFW